MSEETTFAADGSVTGGIASRTVVPSVPLDGGAFSFSAWVKCSDPTLNYNRIFDLGIEEKNENIILSFSAAHGKMYYEVIPFGRITTTSVFPTDRWVLVQLIHRTDLTAEIYWDGIKKIDAKFRPVRPNRHEIGAENEAILVNIIIKG